MAPEDVQVVAKPQRRSFTAKSRRRILREADACTTPGAIGASLGREGLFSSPLVEWRRARARGGAGRAELEAAGRKPAPVDPGDRRIAELERQLAPMTGRAERGEALGAAPQNVAALLGGPEAHAPS